MPGRSKAIFPGGRLDVSGAVQDYLAAHPPSFPVTFAPVATSGDYADLVGAPVLFSGAYGDLTGKPALFSGAYSDLSGKPTLGTASAQNVAAFATAAQGAKADTALQSVPAQTWASITGKPVFFSGAYADLTGKPALATVATSGSYGDLSNKPAIVTYSAATTTVLGVVKQADALTAVASVTLTNNSGGTAATTIVSLPAIQVPALLTAAASKASIDAALASQANNNASMNQQINLVGARVEQLIERMKDAGLLKAA